MVDLDWAFLNLWVLAEEWLRIDNTQIVVHDGLVELSFMRDPVTIWPWATLALVVLMAAVPLVSDSADLFESA